MDCPVCGRKLPSLNALLAQTREGTQCPSCWQRLRRLAPTPLVLGKKRMRSPRSLRRAA